MASKWVPAKRLPGKWLATVSSLLTLLALIVEIRRCIHDASHLLTLLTDEFVREGWETCEQADC